MTSHSDQVGDELFATLEPEFVNTSGVLQELTYREFIVLFYVLALAQRKSRREIKMPSLYQLLRLFTSSSVNSRDYDRLNEFVFEKANDLRIWQALEDDEGCHYIRFYKAFWKENYRGSFGKGIKGWVKVDIDLMLSLNTRTEVLLALFLERWVNKPGRFKHTCVDWLATDIGLKDSNFTKLRQKIERAFRSVRRALGKDGKGLGIHFENVRSNRFSMPAVTISHATKGKSGRVRHNHIKASIYEQEIDRAEKRNQRVAGH